MPRCRPLWQTASGRGERLHNSFTTYGVFMKSIGLWLFIFGAGSFLLNMFNMEFKLLSWIDNWGPTVGLAIRIGLIVVGAALWLIGHKQARGDNQATPPAAG
jgi:hypothetical protein